MKKKLLWSILSIVIATTLTTSLIACGSNSQHENGSITEESENMDEPENTENTQDVEDIGMPQNIAVNACDFALNILKDTDEEDSLVSPLSLMTVTGMAANGAAGDTLTELLNMMGADDLGSFNASVKAVYDEAGKSDELTYANGIWVNGDDVLKEDYVTSVKNIYDSRIEDESFSDKTLQDINAFTKENTKGMIEKLFDDLPVNSSMILVNALSFEGKWDDPFEDYEIDEGGTFTNAKGEEQKAVMLNGKSGELLEIDERVGFTYPYSDGKYIFAALLPKEGESISDFLTSVKGQSIIDAVTEPHYCDVMFRMPEFELDYSTDLSETFKNLGAKSAFSTDADFSNMVEEKGEYYVSDVVHKTHISLNREGTSAAAASGMIVVGSALATEVYEVNLDRPFVYMIIENKTKTPIFVGRIDNLK